VTVSIHGFAAHPDHVPAQEDSQAFYAAVTPQLEGVGRCLWDALALWPSLTGRITVRYKVDQHGKMRDVGVYKDETGQALVGCCIVNQMRQWTVPAPGFDTAYKEYPFDLKYR
jgi:hypothetical protein